jgi:hypothetical protein
MYQKIPLKPHPTGWYVVSASHELKKGDIVTRKFCGKDIIIFRTQSGKACVSDAHCPHMGAHLAHGGVVEGETIQCLSIIFASTRMAIVLPLVMVLSHRPK